MRPRLRLVPSPCITIFDGGPIIPEYQIRTSSRMGGNIIQRDLRELTMLRMKPITLMVVAVLAASAGTAPGAQQLADALCYPDRRRLGGDFRHFRWRCRRQWLQDGGHSRWPRRLRQRRRNLRSVDE